MKFRNFFLSAIILIAIMVRASAQSAEIIHLGGHVYIGSNPETGSFPLSSQDSFTYDVYSGGLLYIRRETTNGLGDGRYLADGTPFEPLDVQIGNGARQSLGLFARTNSQYDPVTHTYEDLYRFTGTTALPESVSFYSTVFENPNATGSIKLKIESVSGFDPGPAAVPEASTVVPFAVGSIVILALVIRKRRLA